MVFDLGNTILNTIWVLEGRIITRKSRFSLIKDIFNFVVWTSNTNFSERTLGKVKARFWNFHTLISKHVDFFCDPNLPYQWTKKKLLLAHTYLYAITLYLLVTKRNFKLMINTFTYIHFLHTDSTVSLGPDDSPGQQFMYFKTEV